MSLFDEIMRGATITNLDGNEVAKEDLVGNEEVATGGDVGSEESGKLFTEETSSGDETVVDTDELNTELLDTQDDVEEIEAVEGDVEKAEEAAVATEALIANLFVTSKLGGLNIQHAELVHEHVSYVAGQLNMPASMVPNVQYSRETFSTVTGVNLATESAWESIKAFFVKILDAILKGVNWIVEKAQALWVKLFQNFDKLEAYAKDLQRQLEVTKFDVPGKEKYKSAGHAKTLMVNGQIKTVAEAAMTLQEVATIIKNDWTPEKGSGDAAKDAKEFEKNVDDLGKSIEKESQNLGSKASHGDIATTGYTYAHRTMEAFGTFNMIKNKVFEDKDKIIIAYLPKNKAIISKKHNDDQEKSLTTYRAPRVADAGVKNGTKSIEVSPQDKSAMNTALASILKLISDLKVVKKKVDITQAPVRGIKAAITQARKKYFQLTDKSRGGIGFMDNIKKSRQTVRYLKDCIEFVKEPGTSFVSFALFEVKSLLDIVKYNIKLMDKEQKN